MGIPFLGHIWKGSENPAVHYSALLRLALPSILLQSGAPIAITIQTAFLGHKAAELVAAWAVVATATNAATVVFNFLVVGVTAKVSKVVGARAWNEVGVRIRLALVSASIMGVVAALLLWALEGPIFLLLKAAPEALVPAQQYFTLRVLGVLPQLLAMCTSGILQGYKRVYLVAGLQIARLTLDVVLSYLALFVFDLGIRGVGLGSLIASSSFSLLAFACILALPPSAGRGKIRIFPKKLLRFWRLWFFSKELSYGSEPLLEGSESTGKIQNQTTDGRSISISEPLSGDGGEWEGGQALPPLTEGAVRVAGGQWEERPRRKEWGGEEDEVEVDSVKESFWKFAWDGLSTMLRTALVQASFFLVLACVTSLGVHAVAAHQVAMQLWMVTVYFADGFATAGTIVGSELAGQREGAKSEEERKKAHRGLQEMTDRLLFMGAFVGVCIGAVYWAFQMQIADLFTSDSRTKDELRTMWTFLIFVQPLNAIVFVYDGLIYAAQAFSFMAAWLSVGFAVFFLPSIGLAYFCYQTLLSAWAAKALLNVVRLAIASYKIHVDFLSPLPSPPHQQLSEVTVCLLEPVELAVQKVGRGSDSRDFSFSLTAGSHAVDES